VEHVLDLEAVLGRVSQGALRGILFILNEGELVRALEQLREGWRQLIAVLKEL